MPLALKVVKDTDFKFDACVPRDSLTSPLNNFWKGD